VKTFALDFAGRSIQGSYPDDWHLIPKAVPKLVVPRELFAVSNRPMQPVPTDSSQPRPMIASLDDGALVIWCYYQVPGDPDAGRPDPTPDYKGPSYPLAFGRSEIMDPSDAREWESSRFLWRRLGVAHNGAKITLWIWQGTNCSSSVLAQAEQVLRSIRISPT
jgi:hypothetical protein